MLKGEISRFFIERLLTHSTDKFRRGTLLCLKKKFGIEAFYEQGGGGRVYHDFPSKVFCLTAAKKIVGEDLACH